MTAILFLAIAFAEPRPTAGQVAEAVKASQLRQASNVRGRQLSGLFQRQQIADTRVMNLMKQKPSAKRNRELKDAKASVVALESEYKAMSTAEVVPGRDLADLDLDKLENGTVGEIRQNAVLPTGSYELSLTEVLSPTRALVRIEKKSARDFESYNVIVVGMDTASAIQGKRLPESFNARVVVTGRPSGRYGAIPVLEVFDLDKPFK